MNLSLALKLLWRDWRAGEITLLLVSLIVAVSTVTTITLFVDRLQQALLLESSTFLAADRVISSQSPVAPEILNHPSAQSLQSAETLSFLSMVFSADRAQFASVKAVSKQYPLRGDLIVADKAFVRGKLTSNGPKIGEVWIESRIMAALDMKVGDSLDVGAATFKVSQVLVKEPDKGGGFENTGPRVMMNLADVGLTEVVQPGSRLSYRYLFAGEQSQITAFTEAVKPQLVEGARIFGVKEGTEGIGKALARAERFLLMGGLLGVILAGVAIALSAQRYSNRHFDHVAILKTLGASPSGIDMLFITILAVLGTLAAIFGSGLGYLVQLAVVSVLGDVIPVVLPEPSAKPIILGLVTGFVCLLSFALPPILKLRNIEPIRVIRRDLGDASTANIVSYAAATVGIFGLMWWYSQDLELAVTIFFAGVLTLSVLSVLAFSLLRSGRVLGMQAGSVWRLALAGMQRRGGENTLHIIVFGLSIMLLLILYLVRTDLLQDWQAQIPENAPNHFAINISPQDVQGIQTLFSENNVDSHPLYPMIRGRIDSVTFGENHDGDQASLVGSTESKPKSSARNLTYVPQLPDDNEVIAGAWWPDNYKGKPLLSLETEVAEHNQLAVGDEVRFSIQGRTLVTEVASIRSVSWDTMQPNFYMILSPGALDEFPSTYMTSFHLDTSQKLFLNTLLRQYPTMTVIEIDAIIAQIKSIINQVTLAIELVLGLIMISGALVLLASIQASLDERFKQHAILRTLGAGQKLIMGSLLIEFCALGLFAGVLATIGAEFTAYFLEEKIFELEYSVNPELWLFGPLLGAVLIGVLGSIATAKVVRTSPTIILRGLN